MSTNPFEPNFQDDPFASPPPEQPQFVRNLEAALLPPPKPTQKKSKQEQMQNKNRSFSEERLSAHSTRQTKSLSSTGFDPLAEEEANRQLQDLFRASDSDLAKMNVKTEQERMDAQAVWDVFAVPGEAEEEDGEQDDGGFEADARLSEINRRIAEHERAIDMLRNEKESILAKRGDPSESLQSRESVRMAQKAIENLGATVDDDDKGNKETVNAIEYMQNGTAMLKYGRRGYPHFRHFELSKDSKEIRWYSGNKASSKTRIQLRNVLDISHGQKTNNFRRHAQPRLAKCSFSLTYVNDGSSNSHTLDVVTKNRMDYLVWTAGLEQITEVARKHRFESDVPLPTNIPVRIPVRNESAIEKRLSLQPEPPVKNVERDLNGVKKKFLHLTKLSRNPKVVSHEEVENTLNQVAKVEEIIESASTAFRSARYSVASHEIWRANVEIQTMTDKLTIIAKSKK